MTKKQLDIEAYIAETEGKILAWQHIIYLCQSCISAHRKVLREMKKKGGGNKP